MNIKFVIEYFYYFKTSKFYEYLSIILKLVQINQNMELYYKL